MSQAQNLGLETKEEEAHDIQAGKSIITQVKEADIPCLMALLVGFINFDQYKQKNSTFQLTDVGGGEGLMVDPFVAMGVYMQVNAIEPDKKRLADYKRKVSNHKQLKVGFFQAYPLQDQRCIVPPSNLLLASHSLYYTSRLWRDDKVSLDQHIFTKLLVTLKPGGSMAVILQSDGSHCDFPGTNAAWEELMYPKKYRLEKAEDPNKDLPQDFKRSADKSYATSELFQASLQKYAEKLEKQTGVTLDVRSSGQPCAMVDLGEINFKPDEMGKYPQKNVALDQLMSYTRGYYTKFTSKEQKDLLGFVEKNCKTEKGYKMAHPNGIFIITPSVSLSMALFSEDQSNSPRL